MYENFMYAVRTSDVLHFLEKGPSCYQLIFKNGIKERIIELRHPLQAMHGLTGLYNKGEYDRAIKLLQKHLPDFRLRIYNGNNKDNDDYDLTTCFADEIFNQHQLTWHDYARIFKEITNDTRLSQKYIWNSLKYSREQIEKLNRPSTY